MDSKLKKGDLVDIVWNGGNRGEYRIETDPNCNLYAVNSYYYNKDGTERDKEAIDGLRFYNPISGHVRSIIKKSS